MRLFWDDDMTLRQKQSLFIRLLAELIDFAYEEGYELTGGELWRSSFEAKRLADSGIGIKNSLHCDRLAIDLNLFKNGKFLPNTDDHLILGMFWESLHPDCRWGGHFSDGNHYSITDSGRK